MSQTAGRCWVNPSKSPGSPFPSTAARRPVVAAVLLLWLLLIHLFLNLKWCSPCPLWIKGEALRQVLVNRYYGNVRPAGRRESLTSFGNGPLSAGSTGKAGAGGGPGGAVGGVGRGGLCRVRRLAVGTEAGPHGVSVRLHHPMMSYRLFLQTFPLLFCFYKIHRNKQKPQPIAHRWRRARTSMLLPALWAWAEHSSPVPHHVNWLFLLQMRKVISFFSSLPVSNCFKIKQAVFVCFSLMLSWDFLGLAWIILVLF